MKAQLVNERIDWIDWKGNWIPDKEDPFTKASRYDMKKELTEELKKIIGKYRQNLQDVDIVEVFQNLLDRYLNK
jgi:hypothetical protein